MSSPPTRTCPFCTAYCTCSSRRLPGDCDSPLISFFAPWPRTGRSEASGSSSPAWARTEPWGFGPSRKRRELHWCRRPARQNSTACPGAPSMPGWPTWWPRLRTCPARSSTICGMPSSSSRPISAWRRRTGAPWIKFSSCCGARPDTTSLCTRRTPCTAASSGA